MKGKYLFIDFETANGSKDIDAVGYVEYVDGEIIKSDMILINPEILPDLFLKSNVKTNQITYDMVYDKDNFETVWNNVLSKYFDGSYIIVAHNALSSDLDDICKMWIRYEIEPPKSFLYMDTQMIAKKHGEPEALKILAKDLAHITYKEHDPEEDSKATLEVLLALIEKYGDVSEPDTFIVSDKINEINKRYTPHEIIRACDFVVGDFPSEFKGKRFCLSGIFSIGDNNIKKILMDNGCELKDIASSKTKCNTDYLIVGNPNPRWKDGKGSKTIAYEKFVQEGVDIKRLTEKEFYDICGIKIKNYIDKETRAKYGLPATKTLKYFPMNDEKPVRVSDIKEEKVFKEWYVVKAILENGDEISIHNDFLAEMQSAGYSRDNYSNNSDDNNDEGTLE